MAKEQKSLSVAVSEEQREQITHSSTKEDVQRHWQGVVTPVIDQGIRGHPFFSLVNRLAVEADSVRRGF